MKIRNPFLKTSSVQIIPLSFLGAIILGTGLLMLPVSRAGSGSADPLTALFTATTSVCVTGLVVVDTFSYWSGFGKVVILLLIQLGGLGIVTMAAATLMLLRRRFSLKNRVLMRDAFDLNTIKGMPDFLRGVLCGTLIVETIGALLYLPVFIPRAGVLRGVWYAFFTSVSAFCNAGIDVLGPDSLISYSASPLMLINTMALIVLGGLGYIVWFDLLDCLRKKKAGSRCRLSVHSKLVLAMTALLVGIGAVIVFCLESSNPETIGTMSLPGKILNSIFQSVTFRTAGFATVPQEGLRESTSLAGCLFMFIGGSPVGTAGGVKTVTIAVVLLNMISFIRDRDEIVLFGRSVSIPLIRKAVAVVSVSMCVTLLFTIILIAVEHCSLADALYEMFSATATVGLSRGLTSSLHTAGRWLVIIAMYLGRIGPVSMAMFFGRGSNSRNLTKTAEGNFRLG
ncbi:MAG: potassium transporter TrkH [Lachnospiraceae bacterium]|nr:potassium transporter TrkH [Lachnospiraceae bacterium]